MKESIGGALLLKIFLVVIVLFVVFVAVSANYARAFRVKNRVIDILEQHEGYTDEAKDLIVDFIASSGYSCNPDAGKDIVDYVVVNPREIIDSPSDGKSIYNVQTCVDWHFPALNINGRWTIKGRTEVIKTADSYLIY